LLGLASLYLFMCIWLRRLVNRYLAAEAHVRFQSIPCRICGKQSGTRTSFSPSTSVFPCQYHSTHPHLNVHFTRRTNRRSSGTLLKVLGNRETVDINKYFREQSHSWKANNSSASEEIHHILWNLYVHFRFDKTSPLVPVPSQVNPLYVFKPYLFKLNFNIILSFTPRFSRLSLFFIFPHQTSCTFSPEQNLIVSTTSYPI